MKRSLYTIHYRYPKLPGLPTHGWYLLGVSSSLKVARRHAKQLHSGRPPALSRIRRWVRA